MCVSGLYPGEVAPGDSSQGLGVWWADGHPGESIPYPLRVDPPSSFKSILVGAGGIVNSVHVCLASVRTRGRSLKSIQQKPNWGMCL